MLTVREFARSQGFPDWFTFVSINDNVVTVCVVSRFIYLVPRCLTNGTLAAPSDRERRAVAGVAGTGTAAQSRVIRRLEEEEEDGRCRDGGVAAGSTV